MASLTYSDLQTRVANQLRISTINTTEMTKIQALINETYRDIYAKSDWFWLLKRQIVNTAANFTTGTINVTNNSTSAITLTSTATIPILASFRLLPTGDTNDPGATYLVSSSHAAGGTSILIDSAYTGATSTGQAFMFSRDSYALASDTGKVLVGMRFGERLPMRRVGWDFIEGLKMSDRTVGKPEVYAVFDFDVTGDPTTQKRVMFHPYPDKTYRIEILYKQTLNTELSGTTRPLIPDDYVQLLVYGSLARGYPIFLNDVERGLFFQNLFNDLMNLMVHAQLEYTRDLPSLAPDDTYRLSVRRRQRAASGVTLGSLFDRWPTAP